VETGLGSDAGPRIFAQPLLRGKLRNDSDGFFRGRPVDANRGAETSDEIVHLPLSPAFLAGVEHILTGER
jgi:hypothetical protein